MSEKRITRSGFTLIELLVVIAILAVLVGLMLSAIQKVRESANRMKCASNMKQLGIAIHAFHDTNRSLPSYNGIFPAGANTAAATNSRAVWGSWFVHLMPFLELPEYNTLASDTASFGNTNTQQTVGQGPPLPGTGLYDYDSSVAKLYDYTGSQAFHNVTRWNYTGSTAQLYDYSGSQAYQNQQVIITPGTWQWVATGTYNGYTTYEWQLVGEVKQNQLVLVAPQPPNPGLQKVVNHGGYTWQPTPTLVDVVPQPTNPGPNSGTSPTHSSWPYVWKPTPPSTTTKTLVNPQPATPSPQKVTNFNNYIWEPTPVLTDVDPQPFIGQVPTQNTTYIWQPAPTYIAPQWDPPGVTRRTNIWNPDMKARIFPILQCPSDFSFGSSTQARIGMVYVQADAPGWGSTNYLANWNAFANNATLGHTAPPISLTSMTDGPSNTIVFGEGYSWCDNSGRRALDAWSLNSTWRFGHNFGITSPLVAGEISVGGATPEPLPQSYANGLPNPNLNPEVNFGFQIRPLARIASACPAGEECCNQQTAQTPHHAMNIVLGDGSVRSIIQLSPATWRSVMLPSDGGVIGADWNY